MLIVHNKNLISHFEARPLYLQPIFYCLSNQIKKIMKPRYFVSWLALFAMLLVCSSLWAQGVSTSSMIGLVTDTKGEPLIGATVIATHMPSGSRYGAITQADGRYTILGMRVGGPYRVTASYVGYQTQTIENIFLTLGTAGSANFKLAEESATTQEVTVTAVRNAAISPDRTGASTSVPREAINSLPTISRNFTDFTRLTPQANGTSFVGQDNRLNNITVDGSYLNNSFGLSGLPGGRANVAPVSLEAIEEVVVSLAPYDVRQGLFVGAGVNLVTRSGTNNFQGSAFFNLRNQAFLGRKAAGVEVGAAANDFNNLQGGFRFGGPIIQDKLFFFVAAETEQNSTPFTLRPRQPGESPGGNISRPTFQQMDSLSRFLRQNFGYETGPFQDYTQQRPSMLNWLAKINYNIDDNNKLSIRYNALDARQDVPISNSSSLGFGARQGIDALSYQNSNYIQFDRFQSVIAELNSTFGGKFSNQIIAGYTYQNEDRGSRGELFPLVEIQESGTTLISFGFEPFTPSNQLSYSTLQFQDNFSYFAGAHTITAGLNLVYYSFRNVFFPGSQSVYVYSSLEDWYTDANDYLRNPNRTQSPVTLRRFQYRYSALPGGAEPVQPTRAWNPGIYVQDEWQILSNLRVTGGLRVDIPFFENTAFENPIVPTLEFRDGNGNRIESRTDRLPQATPLFSPRLGFNWNVLEDNSLQVRGGTGVFTGQPAFVWISNQIGNNGVLTGFEELNNTRNRPFNPSTTAYRPANPQLPTSIELATTDPNFRFPQVWRTNLGVDYLLPLGIVATFDGIYTKTLAGISYINANLRPATRTFAGPDQRLRYDGTTGNANRLNANVTSNVVLQNSGEDYAISLTAQLQKSFGDNWFGLIAYTYTDARNNNNPGSIAFGSWANNPVANNPNLPELGFSAAAVPHRVLASGSYRFEYGIGATTISLFWSGAPQGRFSYTYGGDMNQDGVVNNDLIFVPNRASDLLFLPLTTGGRTFTPEEQAAAFDAFIEQDDYLRTRRGQYAERNGAVFPWVFRADLAVIQDFYLELGGQRNGLQLRLDIFNVGNLLNSEWGVGWQRTAPFPLTAAGVSADGRPQFRMATITTPSGPQLLNSSFQRTASIADLWSAQFSIRYTFN